MNQNYYYYIFFCFSFSFGGLTVYSLELSKGEVVICERRIHPERKISETSEQDIICGICESSS